jgi:hypothetical protein
MRPLLASSLALTLTLLPLATWAQIQPVSLSPRDQRLRSENSTNYIAPQYDVSLTTPRSVQPGRTNPWLGQPGAPLAYRQAQQQQAYAEQKAAAELKQVSPPAPAQPIGGKVPPLTVYQDPPPLTGDRIYAWDKPLPPRDPNSPRTETGIEVGGQFGRYFYKEPSITEINGQDISVSWRGFKYGATGQFTTKLSENWFARADTRFTYGTVDYKGYLQDGTPAKSKNIEEYNVELRAMVGYDFVFGRWVIAPSLGLGYRYLSSDHGGQSLSGYGRENHLLFLPVAVEPRVQLDNGDRLSLYLEYDQLLRGWQQSHLEDAIPGAPTLSNNQLGGYGLRGNLWYQRGKWSFGPYINYWNIDSSNVDCGTGELYSVCGYEPHNYTVDYGIQVKFRLY